MAIFDKESPESDPIFKGIGMDIARLDRDNQWLAQVLYEILDADIPDLDNPGPKKTELLYDLTQIINVIDENKVRLKKTNRFVSDYLIISEESFREAKETFADQPVEEICKRYEEEKKLFEKKFGFNYPMVAIITLEKFITKFPIGKSEKQIELFKKNLGIILRMIRKESEKEEKEK